MNCLTTSEINSQRTEIESALAKQKKAIDQRSKNVFSIAGIVFSACVVTFFVSFKMDVNWGMTVSVVLSAMFSGVAASQVIREAFSSNTVKWMDAITVTSAVVFSIVGALFISDAVGVLALHAMTLCGAINMAFLFNEGGKVEKLEKQLQSLTEISPQEHPGLCNCFAKWVDAGEPLALELYENLDGRKPTVGEIKSLEWNLKSKPTKIKKAEEECKRLFGENAQER